MNCVLLSPFLVEVAINSNENLAFRHYSKCPNVECCPSLLLNVGSTQSYRAESTSDYHVTRLTFHANWHQPSRGSLSIIYTQLVIRAFLI